MAGPAIVARRWKTLIYVYFTPAPSITRQTPAQERLQGLAGHDDDWKALVALDRGAHRQPPEAAPPVLARPVGTRVVIHRFHLHPTLPEKDLFDAFEEGGHTTGIHVLIMAPLDSCEEKRPVVLFVGPIELHRGPQARELGAGDAQEVKVVVGQEVLHCWDTEPQEDAAVYSSVGKASKKNTDVAGDCAVNPVTAEDSQIEGAISGPWLGVQITSAPGDTEEARHP